MLLSIVVPVHNAAAYLPAMLDSLFAQQYAEREVILVDDGSIDGSSEILEAYRRRHGATRVVWQKQAGVSAARNRGIELARGEYVALPDADDVLQPEMYAVLMAVARAEDLDVALCNARFLRADGAAELICGSLADSGVTSGAQWLETAISARDMLHAVWRGVYRTHFLRSAGLRFIPGLAFRQDVPWTTEILALAGRMRYLPVSMYLYRVGVRRFDALRWRRVAQSYFKVVELLERLNDRQPARLGPALRWQIADQGLRIFHQTRRMPDADERLAVYEEMRARGIDTLILRNARGLGQTSRALRRLGEMHVALAARRLLSLDAERLLPFLRLAPFFARAPRRRRAP